MPQEKKRKEKQMKKKSRFAYAKKEANTSRLSTVRQSQIDSTSWKLYRDCRITLDIFLECLIDKEYSRLIISGDPPEEEILTAWSNIYLEYAELQNGGGQGELFSKVIEINSLHAKIHLADRCITHLKAFDEVEGKLVYNEEVCKILTYYGLNPSPKIAEDDSIMIRWEKLSTVHARAKRWVINLQLLHKEYEELQGDTEQIHSRDGGRAYYEDWLSSISTQRRYAVLEKDISVRQFVKAVKEAEKAYFKSFMNGN